MVCPRTNSEPSRNCQTNNIVYKANMTLYDQGADYSKHNYLGATERELQKRVSYHNSCMQLKRLEDACELSKTAQRLRREGKNFEIRWSIIEKSKGITPGENIAHSVMTKCMRCSSKRTMRPLMYSRWILAYINGMRY